MNLISNNDTNSANSSGWSQASNNRTNNWDLDTNLTSQVVVDTNSQWLINSNPNSNQSVSNINSSSLNSQHIQQLNSQSGQSDLDNNSSSSLMNEPHHSTNSSTDSTASNQLDSSSASNNELNNNDLKSSLLIKDEKFSNPELYSDNWGNVPINQNTAWDFPSQSNYQVPPREVHSYNGLIDNSWKFASSTTGTDIWEANIRKKSLSNEQIPNGDQSTKQNSQQNWNSATNSSIQSVPAVAPLNHIGGTWGEDENPIASIQSKMWNGPSSNNSGGLNSTASINNQNWNDPNEKQWVKQWNPDSEEKSLSLNKGINDSLFSTWNANSLKDLANPGTGWQANTDTMVMNDNLITEDSNLVGTALWKQRQNGGIQNTWKDDNNDLLLNKNKLNNMTNQTSANGLNAHMQNGNTFSTASPGVLRIPSANPMNNKVQTMQPNNGKPWIDQSTNWNDNLNNQKNNGSNILNGQSSNGMFWNNEINSNTQLNWNKSSPMNNNNQQIDDWNLKLKKEMIMQSHQFKLLADKGFRKENIEAALRNSNMNIKDAIDELRADVLKENSNDLDKRKNSGFNHTSSLPPNSSISNRNTSQFNQMSQQPNQMFRNNNNLNNNKIPNAANAMLQDKRVGNLVQQIQLAVQSGHLNAQILNQPLSGNTIHSIHQLLQLIKNLQTLQLQSTPNMNKNINIGPTTQSDLNVQITMIKQRISNLQNQIKLHQAVFISQQQQNNQSVPNNQSDLNNLNNLNSNLNNLTNSLSINPSTINNPDFAKGLISPDSPNLAVNEFRDNNQQQQQSRLITAWKNSTNFNDNLIGNNQAFSRAPGSIKSNTPSWSSTGFNSADESTWLNDANDIANALSNINVQNQTTTTTAFINDSVPEFEPGKPWKGSQIKSSDDDPHLTPGSVNRSIISLNNFNNWAGSKTSATLSNPTWSFNNNTNVNNQNTANSQNWNGFPNDSSSPVENLWQSGSISKIKAPPGLSPTAKNKNVSSYLLIKNLTPQIDASTLRTLCLQHGPLQMFNLLNNGVALVKYKSKEEAIKAQPVLNNCFISNTTILVDLVPESEVQQYLSGQQIQTQPTLNGIYRNGQTMINSNTNPWRNNAITAESPWAFNGNNPWNNSIDATTTMQNLLPGDLLNGESA